MKHLPALVPASGPRLPDRGLPNRKSGLFFLLMLLCGLLLGSASVFAAPTPAPAEPAFAETRPVVEQATVSLDGVLLFPVRGTSAYPAKQRAADIADRIRAVAHQANVRADSLRVVETEGKSTILAGEQLLISLVDADARIEDINRRILADMYRKRIADAIVAYRADRSPDVLIRNALYSVGATLALFVLILGLNRTYRWLSGLATQRITRQMKEVAKKTMHLFDVRQLWRVLDGALKGLYRLIIFLMVYVYLNFVLELFPWTRPTARVMLDLIMDPLRALGSALLTEIPNLITLAIVFLVARYVLRLIMLFFSAVERGSIKVDSLDQEVIWPTYRILRLMVIVFALVVAYPYIPGSETDAFKGISLFMGLIFSLGSTTVIGNIVAGYTMIYRRAFKLGDRIRVGDVMGEVMDRKLLVTRLRSFKNEEIIIPNSEILNSSIVNYSAQAKTRGLILHTTVGIGYETPWRQVEAMLLLAASRTPGLLTTPEPFVMQKSLGDFCVIYEINAYCDQPDAMFQLYTALHQNILDVFNEYGVQIMTPAYEADTPEPKLVPRERWFEAPARPPASN